MAEKKDISFEEAIERLESIVGDLEKGNCGLDKSLELFEEGILLVKECSGKLDAAAQKVKVLTENGEVPFDAPGAGE